MGDAPWNGGQAHSDTKPHGLLLTFGVARHWPDVSSNAISPGWVPTRMGGPGAPDVRDADPQDRLPGYCRDVSGIDLKL